VDENALSKKDGVDGLYETVWIGLKRNDDATFRRRAGQVAPWDCDYHQHHAICAAAAMKSHRVAILD